MAHYRMTAKTKSSPMSWLLLVLQFSAVCLAQNDASATVARASSTSSAAAQTHTIAVGLADHKFIPDVTKAAIGDTVEFRFYPANHSVVRAEYGMPCIPYEMTGSKKTGFFSGFNAVDKVLDDPPKYQIAINDTSPIFFYCSAPGSCLTYGMVGAINPTNSTPIANQQKLAKGSAYMLNPGEPFPAEAPLPSNIPGATPVPVPIAAPAKKSGLSAGAVAGIVVGAISVVVLAALLFFFGGRTKTLKDEVERKDASVARRTGTDTGSTAMLETPLKSPGVVSGYATTYNSGVSSYFPGTHQKHNYTSSSPPTQQHHIHSPPHTFTSPTSPTISELPSESYMNRVRSASPHCLAQQQQEKNLGPYGVQQGGASAPPYGFHVNERIGPQEMEGTPVGVRGGGEGKKGEGNKARWEEVRGEEGRMF